MSATASTPAALDPGAPLPPRCRAATVADQQDPILALPTALGPVLSPATRCACGEEEPCETWLCPGCEQQRPYCEGCSDALYPICDHCWHTVRQALQPGAAEERIRQAAAEAAGQLRLLAEPAPPLLARLFVWLPAAAAQKEADEAPWTKFDAPLWKQGGHRARA